MSILVRIQPSHHLTCIHSSNFGLSFKMVDWTFNDALTAIQSLPSILTCQSYKACRWSLFSRHMLRQDSDYLVDAHHAHCSSREMGRGWKLQSGVHG